MMTTIVGRGVALLCILAVWLLIRGLRAPSTQQLRSSYVHSRTLAFVSALLGLVLTVFWVIRTMRLVEGDAVPADQKAKLMAEGISNAMNVGMSCALPFVLSLVVAVVLWKRHRQAAEEEAPAR